MSEFIGTGDETVLIAGGESARVPTCNRHSDCAAAMKKAEEEEGRNPYVICCHSDDCEECFGS
jgi:hypothetical protein